MLNDVRDVDFHELRGGAHELRGDIHYGEVYFRIKVKRQPRERHNPEHDQGKPHHGHEHGTSDRYFRKFHGLPLRSLTYLMIITKIQTRTSRNHICHEDTKARRNSCTMFVC